MLHTLRFIKKVREAEDVYSFIFEGKERFDWIPGQYLKYKLESPQSDARGTTRYFTIASAPPERYVQITTRIFERSSTFKSGLMNLNEGTTIEADGPRGSFIYPDPENNIGVKDEVVFVAGGIGITPFRSILVDLGFKGLNPKITLIYANRDNASVAFKELFDGLSTKHDNLKVHYLEGKLTAEDILNISGKDKVIYLSGPEPMVEGLDKSLKISGISQERIKTDFFPGYDDKL